MRATKRKVQKFVDERSPDIQWAVEQQKGSDRFIVEHHRAMRSDCGPYSDGLALTLAHDTWVFLKRHKPEWQVGVLVESDTGRWHGIVETGRTSDGAQYRVIEDVDSYSEAWLQAR